jgi:hypothetical protein
MAAKKTSKQDPTPATKKVASKKSPAKKTSAPKKATAKSASQKAAPVKKSGVSPPEARPPADPGLAHVDDSDREARVAVAAYLRWVDRGRVDGHHVDDWLEAEQSLPPKKP